MVNIGIIGIGFMGMTHYKAIQNIEDATVAAICTRNPKKLQGDWRDIKGNFGDDGGVQDLSQVRKYTEVSDILADPGLDLIDICLPTHMHPDVAVQALDAGRHVLVEKPIARALENADRMIEAAERTGKFLMVAQVLRFFPEFAFVKETVENGEYGEVLGAHFKRIISRPTWGSGDWFSHLEKMGGAGIDLHIHDTDFVQYVFGMPDAVFSTGVSTERFVDYLTTNYIYEGRNMSITASSGWINMPGLMFEHGYDIFLERATIQFNSSWGGPVALYTSDGEKTTPELSSEDGFVGEIGYAVRCIEEGRTPENITGTSARNALMLCHKEAESVISGQVVRTNTDCADVCE